MTYIVEATAPNDLMRNRYEDSIYTLSAEYTFKDQAQEVASIYRSLGCKVRILKETIQIMEVEE